MSLVLFLVFKILKGGSLRWHINFQIVFEYDILKLNEQNSTDR